MSSLSDLLLRLEALSAQGQRLLAARQGMLASFIDEARARQLEGDWDACRDSLKTHPALNDLPTHAPLRVITDNELHSGAYVPADDLRALLR